MVAFGIASFVANLVGGIIYASLGVVVFGVSAILMLIGAGIGWRALPVRVSPGANPVADPRVDDR